MLRLFLCSSRPELWPEVCSAPLQLHRGTVTYQSAISIAPQNPTAHDREEAHAHVQICTLSPSAILLSGGLDHC